MTMVLLFFVIFCLFGFYSQVSGLGISAINFLDGAQTVCTDKLYCQVTTGKTYTMTFKYTVGETIASSMLRWEARVGAPDWWFRQQPPTLFKGYHLCRVNDVLYLQEKHCNEFTLLASPRELRVFVPSIKIPKVEGVERGITKDVYITDGTEKLQVCKALAIKQGVEEVEESKATEKEARAGNPI